MEMKGLEFDRGDLARHIAKQSLTTDNSGDQYFVLDEDAALLALDKAASGIADALSEFQRVEFHELGVFALEARPERSGVDPQGNTWNTPAGLRVVFRPAPTLMRIIAERTGQPTY